MQHWRQQWRLWRPYTREHRMRKKRCAKNRGKEAHESCFAENIFYKRTQFFVPLLARSLGLAQQFRFGRIDLGFLLLKLFVVVAGWHLIFSSLCLSVCGVPQPASACRIFVYFGFSFFLRSLHLLFISSFFSVFGLARVCSLFNSIKFRAVR